MEIKRGFSFEIQRYMEEIFICLKESGVSLEDLKRDFFHLVLVPKSLRHCN